jgi:1,4-dihydroxy-2-naphthoate octaprenyltransferase
MGSLSGYLGVARAPFLALPFALVAAGVGAAAFGSAAAVLPTFLSLVGLLAAHASVNALNEVSDFRTGIDLQTVRTPFSGGSGTLPGGALDPKAAFRFAMAAFLVACGAALWLVFRVGWSLVPVIAAGAVCVLAYTDFLARIGVGEIAAGLGLGGLPVAGVAIAQGHGLPRAAVAASVPAFLMTFNLLLLNEFPDERADRAGGRRNLVILLGRPAAARIYSVAGFLTPVSIGAFTVLGWLPPLALVGALPSALLLPPVRWALTRPEEPVPLPALGANVVWNLATNFLLAAGLVAEVIRHG